MSGRYYEESRLYSAIQRPGETFEPLGRSYRSSRLKRVFDGLKRSVDRLAYVTRQAFLFRWLTAEPDVIVIDLRETWTVGPFVAPLDRLAPHAVRTWNGSSSRQTLYRAADLFRRGPVQLTSGFFLGILLANLVLTWGSLGPVSLAFQLFFVALALLGLRVDWTWDELEESSVGRLAESLLVPPEPPDDDDRN